MKRYLALIVLAAVPIYGQTLDLKGLDKLKAKASEVVDLNLGKDMLKMGAGFLGDGKGDEAKIKKLIDGLNSVMIKSFEFESEGAYTNADVEDLITRMSTPGWSMIVSADERKSHEVTRIWMKAGAEGAPGGLRVLSAEAKELTVIEIVGRIRLEDLKDLGGLGVRDVVLDHSGAAAAKKEE